MTAPFLLAALLLQAAQDSPMPWRTDFADARKECIKSAKPCVLLINVDRDTTSQGSVALHLKRSAEMRELCAAVTVAVVHQYEEAGLALMKEFGGGYFGFCKIVVLDGVGELLAFFPAYDCLDDASPASEKRFAGKIVERIRAALNRKESLQGLERRWKAEGNDPGVLDRLLDRLTELNFSDRFHELAEAAIDDPARAPAVRNVARAWTFPLLAEGSEVEVRAKETANAERLLAEVAGYEGAGFLLRTLMIDYYAEQFDVPSKVAAAAVRLEKAAASQSDPSPLRKRIGELQGLLREWTADWESELKTYDPDAETALGARVKAMLGDARVTVNVLGALPVKERQPYERWIEEARKKLEKR